MVTNMFFACKNKWLDLNLRPAIIKEFNVFCILIRMCYSYAEDKTADVNAMIAAMLDCIDKLALAEITIKADWIGKYNYNHTAVMKSYRSCARPHIPRDVRYVLASLMWIKNLMSG
ncbi:uncharacterized protein LOC125943078 isoform X2 [Dermacentor silvarum]|uniref:uncharacterized protein LOC125943078 isoform X1 n=1 Tax=Dermacentor silvarum TaxID=543639 RepID=UPI002101857F|nr:uncharacterized protein LOC125943078 isoform X1 [Dermacentor silvarum]XP_049517396.1 uncharacterized protein LOC125943078 isoform X2 [Dermacentor silvarum]